MADLAELQQRLGHNFAHASLLRLALTHPSVTHEQAERIQTNQRLEFLGDAVLQLALSAALYEKFPQLGEGALTKTRARLVNRDALAARARALGLGAHLILALGEDKHGGREKNSALADAFEAILGAIFLDGGFATASEFILREFSAALAETAGTDGIENPKGELQELLQSKSDHAPVYEDIAATGPDHNRTFESRVLHEGIELARGSGGSKKAAESNAALAALTQLRQKK